MPCFVELSATSLYCVTFHCQQARQSHLPFQSDVVRKLLAKLRSKLAGPKAAPIGRKQMKCRILPDQLVYNVEWSMVNACTPQGEPILGTGGEKKYVHWFRMKFQIALTSDQLVYNVEKHNILYRPHPMIIRSSLHNPIATAFPDGISLQRCLPSVGRFSSFPWSSGVPFKNPASPTFRGQGCNIRSEPPYCPDACHRPRFQSSVVRQHLYFVVPPI